MQAYQIPPEPATVLPDRVSRRRVFLDWLNDRFGSANLTDAAYAGLRHRGLRRAQVDATVSELVDARLVRVRRGVGVVHVELAPAPVRPQRPARRWRA